AMTRSLEESGEKVSQLSDSVAFFKSIIPDTKEAIASAEKSIDMFENKCRHLEDIISAKDRKIIALVFWDFVLSDEQLIQWVHPQDNIRWAVVVNSNNASIFDNYINQELEKRLGVIEINLAKLTNLIREDTIDTKSARYRYSESSDYNNRGLEKRIEQIEANLAKFARKNTKGAKTSQRQRSESSPFGGLEK
ncbi:9039_t:CDS:2, partial [Funneliformis geosporum]